MALFKSRTKMKKIVTTDAFSILELGDKMYLILPKEEPQRVIISAHGGHHMISKTNQFKVPIDTVLRFYSDDTYSVLDPGLGNFFRAQAAPKEIISEGEYCFDYILSKYQGKHGSKDETYESITKLISDAHKYRKMDLDDADKASKKGNTARANQLLTHAKARTPPAVLTIRNRRFTASVTLSMAISETKAAAPSIQIFDCLFCRSTMRGGSQKVDLVKNIV